MQSLKGFAYAVIVPLVLVAVAGPAAAASFHVHTINFSFSPNSLTLGIGDTVTWDNHDGVTHTVTDIACPRANGPGPCEFDSQFTMTPGQSFTHTFNVGGVFDYKCTIHGFTGTLTVPDPNTDPDLVIAALTFQDGSGLAMATTKQVRATVTNTGGEGAGRSNLIVQYLYKGTWKQIGASSVPALHVGGSQLFVFTWTVTGKIGDFPVRATADNLNQVTELSEGNNALIAITSVMTPPGVLPGIDLLDP